MASSSPLSDPPSSPPRSPSRDRSHKRGSYDPSTPRTARRLKSAERNAFDFTVRPVKAAMEPATRGRPATSRSKSIFDSMPKETFQAEKSALFSVPNAPKKSTATKPTAGQPADTTLPGGKGGGQERANLVASAVFGSLQTKDGRSPFPVSNPTALQTKNDKSPFPATNPFPRAQSAMGKYETGGRIGDDSDESQPTTPTPLAKTAQALHKVQDHTIPYEVDRHWTAFESSEAYRKIISRIYDSEGNIEGNFLRVLKHEGWTKAKVAEAVTTAVTTSLSPSFNSIEKKIEDKVGKMRNALVGELVPLKGIKEEVVKTSQTTFSLTKAVESNASQLATLTRTVEQLSGQLIAEAKRNRQQQELLEKIWKKVNAPQQNVVPAIPRQELEVPKPPPTAVSREVTMMDQASAVESLPKQQQAPPPPPSPKAPLADLSASKHNPTAKPPATPVPEGPPKPPPSPPRGPPRSFASVAASPAPEGWKVVQ